MGRSDAHHHMARVFLAASGLLGQAALGAGFEVTSQGAQAAGQGDAYTAQADDPSAIYYNPAGLTQVPGTQVTAGVYAVFPDFKFRSPSGNDEMTENSYLPQFYLTTNLGLERWRFGLGVNDLFGLKEAWSDTGPLSTNVTDERLTVINIAPTAAYQINDHLSVGGGLNIYCADMDLHNRIELAPQTEGSIRIDGSGQTVGGTVGTLWTINSQNALGLVYRSPFRLDFDGSAQVTSPGLPTAGPSDTSARINFPQSLTAGYAWRPLDRLKLEADVQWTDWDTLQQIGIKSDDPRFSALPARQFDYQNTFTYRFGVQYELDPHWTLRAGYIYSPSAVPDETFSAQVVDLDSHVFTVGIGYSQPHWEVDMAYNYILGMERTVNDSVNSPPGTYSDNTSAVMASLTLKF